MLKFTVIFDFYMSNFERRIQNLVPDRLKNFKRIRIELN